MQILNNQQIHQKIDRIAYQIYEQNYGEQEIYLIGINNNGSAFSKKLARSLKKISNLDVIETKVSLSPANPILNEVSLGVPIADLKNKVVIVVDDVANTGRTIYYSFRPLLSVLPKRVQVAVLVDRAHKHFPIHVDYVGISLATTLKENIRVELSNDKNLSAYLE